MKTFREIIEKYFKDKNEHYFHGSDVLHTEEGDTYLRYKMINGKAYLYFGGQSGEVCIKVCRKPEELENVIRVILE